MRVVITGSSGCLAAALVPALCADPLIECVTGIDIRPTRYQHTKFRAHAIDIASALDPSVLRRHDAFVHLAYVVLRGNMPLAAMRNINVQASLRVLRQAAESGISRLISLSSAAVYGGGSNLSEQAPLRPLPGFAYGAHKAELEDCLQTELPHCLRLRPHVILGRHAQPLLRTLLAAPLYPRSSIPEPLIQCVHELDVVAAIRAALGSTTRGALNLAAPETFSYARAVREIHRFALPVPLVLAQSLLNWSWRLSGLGGEPGWLQGLTQPLTLNCERARHELGWVPRYSASAAISATSG